MADLASVQAPRSVKVLEPRTLTRTARYVLAAIAGLLALALTGYVVSVTVLEVPPHALLDDGFFYVLVSVVGGVLGTMILRRLPANHVGWLMMITAAIAALVAASFAFRWLTVAQWVVEWLPVVPITLLPVPMMVFPDGPLDRRSWTVAWRTTIVLLTLPPVTFAAAALLSSEPIDDLPDGSELSEAATMLVAAGAATTIVVLVVVTGFGVASLVQRRAVADARVRRQIRLLAVGFVLVAPSIALEAVVAGAWIVAVIGVPIAMTIAIVAHGLYDMDLFINRSVVYAVLTLVVFATYSVAVAAFQQVLQAATGLAATGLVAAVFVPIRERVQRAVNHLLYGERDDPYSVVTRLGNRLEAVLDPDSVVPGIVETVANALRLPYVELKVKSDGRLVTAAKEGRLVGAPSVFPMRHGGRSVGQLVASPRQVGHGFTDEEADLLADIAQRSAPAVVAAMTVQDARAVLAAGGPGRWSSAAEAEASAEPTS